MCLVFVWWVLGALFVFGFWMSRGRSAMQEKKRTLFVFSWSFFLLCTGFGSLLTSGS